MSLPATISNTLIEGNIFGDGYYTTNGTIISVAEYASLLVNSCDAQIKDNIFSGQAAAGNMVSLTNCSCLITNNKFLRRGKSIVSFISNTGSNDQIVKGNLFDSSTIDGSSESLVTGFTATSYFKENKNQIDYCVVRLFDYGLTSPGQATSSSNIGGWEGAGEFTNIFTDLDTSPNVGFFIETDDQIAWKSYLPFSNIVPAGAQILELKIGALMDRLGTSADADPAGTNQIDIYLRSYNRSANYTAGTNSILDVANNFTPVSQTTGSLTYDNTTDFNSLVAAVRYCTLNIEGNSNFSLLSHVVEGWVAVNYKVTDICQLTVSPLVIKYAY